MSNYKMVFVFPVYDESGVNFTGTKFHLGVSYISAFLASKGISTTQYIKRVPVTLDEMAGEILSLNPMVVGFSTYDKNFHVSRQIARKINEKNKDTKIVFGGPTATFCDQLVLEQMPFVDLCARGEAEETAYDLLNAWENGNGIDDIPGITYRTSGGEIKRNPDRTALRADENGAELNVFPSPYVNNMVPPELVEEVGLLSSRGCPYRCVYCSNAAFARHRISYHSVERVIDELRVMNSYGRKLKITFFDDAFTIILNRAKQICRRIIEEKFTNLTFSCLTRIDKCDEELFRLLKEAGFTNIAFGLESGSPKILRNIKKTRHTYTDENDFEPEKRFLSVMQENVKLARSMGFGVSVSIIVGLPGETPEEGKQSVEFVRQLGADYYTHNTLAVFSGTELADICEDYGMKIEHGPFFLPYQLEHTYNTASIPHLPNSMTQKVGIMENYKTSNQVKETFGAYRGETFEYYPRLVLLDEVQQFDDTLLTWLDTMIGMDTAVVFKNEKVTYDQYDAKITQLARYGIPLIKYSQLRRSDEAAAGVEAYTLNDVQYGARSFGKMNYYRFIILPYSYDDIVDTGREKVFMREIKDAADLERFDTDMVAIHNDGGIELDRVGEINYDILDKCRWTGCKCPGLDLSCVTINQNGDMACCQHSKVLGNVKNDSFAEIKTTLAKLMEETRKRRGCAECPVAEKCSKCMFLPEFISEEEYCAFRRQRAWLSESVEAVEMGRKVLMQVHLKRVGNLISNKLDISAPGRRFFLKNADNESNKPASQTTDLPHPSGIFSMISISGNYFLYNKQSSKIIRMNEKMGAIYECLEERTFTKESLADWIAERYFVEKKEAEAILAGAVEKFNSMNILVN